MMRLRRRKKDKKKNGEMKAATINSNTQHSPPPERKSKFSAIGKIFKPWKWKRKKKSEKIERTAKEIERKISIRSTREELIRKGVLKDVEHDPQAETEPPPPYPGEQATPENSQHKVEISSEPNHVQPETVTDENSKEVTIPECNGTTKDDSSTEETITEPNVITTQAEITPVNANTTAPVLTTAQVRPMVFPHLQPASTPDSSSSTPTQDKPQASSDTSAMDQTASETEMDQKTLSETEMQAVKDPDKEEELDPTGTFHIAPASEWDISKLPKKSALKGAGGTSSDAIEPHSVNFSSVDTMQSSSEGVEPPTSEPKSSPKPTPVAAPRPKLKGGFVKFSSTENKENLSETPVAKQSFTNSQSDKGNKPEYNPEDSSSDDEEIRYRDDEEDEEAELSTLAAKVARQDSLARFLSNRPSRKELVDKNIIPENSISQTVEDRSAIGSKLIRRLSLRPTQEELEQRNILHTHSTDQAAIDKEEKKRYLIRKLSFRPSIEELKERKIIKFSDYVEWTDAHEYDRRADKPWTRLTPKDKAAIRKELNEFKSKEMDVHEESKHLTRFHRP